MLSHFSRVRFLYDSVDSLPLSVGFSRQEYWSELPCPPPGNLPDPGTERASPALAGGFFTTSTMWEAPKHFIPGLIEILIFAL